jgi:hypothetical protein
VASADLGALGPKAGSPVVYRWVVPSVAPLLFPWLAILVLLMLKPNRCASAWWIWLPLGCVAAVGAVPQSSESLLGAFFEVITALGFSLAAVWLLGPHLGRQHRFLTFLCLLPALAGFGGLVLAARQGLAFETETLQIGIILAASLLMISVALTLAGWLCRKRYGRIRFAAWLVASLLVSWTALVVPFFVVIIIASGNGAPAAAMISAILVMTGVCFGVLLPFLILSFASPFFHDRLKTLLRLGGEAAPPLVAVPVPVVNLKSE